MIHTFDGYELDLDRFELRRDGDRVAVEPQVVDVLAHLVEHRTRVVPKVELLESVSNITFVTESALTSRVKDARQAVGADGRSQRMIRTVTRRGYRFVAPVEVFVTPPSGPSAASRPTERRVAVSQEIRFRASSCCTARSPGVAWRGRARSRRSAKPTSRLTWQDVGWGRDDPAFRHVFALQFMPEGTRELWSAFDELQRRTTTPPLVEGRSLATLIPDSRLVMLDSANHILLRDEPAWARFVVELDGFLGD